MRRRVLIMGRDRAQVTERLITESMSYEERSPIEMNLWKRDKGTRTRYQKIERSNPRVS